MSRLKGSLKISAFALVLCLGTILTVGATFASAGLLAWRYEEVLGDARDDLRSAGKLLAAEVREQSLQVDRVVREVADCLTAERVNFPADLEAVASERAASDFVAKLQKSVGGLDSLSILNERGRLTVSSRRWPAPVIDLSDRDFFRAHLNEGVGAFWDKPIRNRLSGSTTMGFSRRFDGPDGRMTAVVVGGVSMRDLAKRLSTVRLPDHGQVELTREDGVLIARSQATAQEAQSIDRPAPGTSVQMPGAEAEVAPDLRVVVAVPDTGLLVTLSVPRDSVLASWRREALVVGGLMALFYVMVVVTLILSLRNARAVGRLVTQSRHAALHDTLTGLPNRAHLNAHLAQVLATAAHTGMGGVTLTLLDIDNFEVVNHTSLSMGDDLLRRVADRLRVAMPRNGFLARLGGDKFAIVTTGGTTFGASSVSAALAEPIVLPFGEFHVTCSGGTALGGRDAQTAADLFVCADLALLQAKAEGRDRLVAYAAEMGARRQERLAMQRDLRRALDHGELHLHYQPIVDLRRGRVVAFEALLRWRNPQRGAISPGEFIAVAEEAGLIGRLGCWVLDEACRTAATWPEHVKVAVNLSPIQFRTQDLFAQISSALRAANLPAERLTLEISGSIPLETTREVELLAKLRAIGVRIALDDVGTGLTMLTRLRQIPVDVIKFDLSVIRRAHQDDVSDTILRAIVGIAHRFGVEVAAKGVETAAQLEMLSLVGCVEAQGYWLGRPVAAAQVPTHLVDPTRAAPPATLPVAAE